MPEYQAPRADDVMDVDTAHAILGKPVDAPRLAKLFLEERDKGIAEGSCFKCRKPGHTTKTCPDKGLTVSSGVGPAKANNQEGRKIR